MLRSLTRRGSDALRGVDRSCPACDGADYQFAVRVRGVDIVQCTTCHLATWAWPRFSPETFYDASYWRSDDVGKGYADYFAYASATHRTHASRVRRLLRLTGAGPKQSEPDAQARGMPQGGDARHGDEQGRDARRGDERRGDEQGGDALLGDEFRGGLLPRLRFGLGLQGGDARRGDEQGGDERRGDAQRGDARRGDTQRGDSLLGHEFPGGLLPRLRFGLGLRDGARGVVACGAGAGRWLDAGCGPGFFVRAARVAGVDACGVEVSEFAVEFARRELGLDVRCGRVDAAGVAGGPYDVVTLWDVIEHLPDPRASLAAVHDALAPGGLVAISTGDLASLAARLSGPHWHLWNLPEHLWFFTAGSLRRLLHGCGFSVIDASYDVTWCTVRYAVERIEAMFGAARRTSTRLGRLGEIAIPATLADVVTVVARK